ncbi:4'-phosphopantetheinyl transferase family protein [Lysinibacillus sp. NPDC097231]|uniref:4'-phosphopantetheinyl transferase family protein n=1 Tax=Lysinibacillus sp. NPDC097231 TaxID=3364142 RepID=UPI00382EDE8B
MLTFNDGHIFALPIGPQLKKSERDMFLSSLSNDEQLRIVKYKHWKDQQRALLGSILVRWSIQHLTDVQHIQIARDKQGRPYMIGNDSWKGDFNLSHSGEWIVVALTHEGSVGIDVEKIKLVSDDVMRFAMSQDELQILQQHAELEQLKLFYEFWTMKEALFKTGLLPITAPHLLNTIAIRDTYKDFQTQLIYLDKLHPVSICWSQKQLQVDVTILNKQEIKSKLGSS